jgi:predicted HD superfamily hydrolase involved in NAD metabolism
MIETAYLPFLTKTLSPRRLEHSLGVMQTMGELAAVYGQDVEKARAIGLLHDAAKELPQDVWQQMVRKYNIPIRNEAEGDYNLYLHGPVSAFFVQQELGVTDELILGAIATHCFFGDGSYFDHPLSWCMRFSDLIEPSRNFSQDPILLEFTNRLREAAFAGRMWEAAAIQTDGLIRWYPVKGFPTHPNFYTIRDKMTARVAAGEE